MLYVNCISIRKKNKNKLLEIRKFGNKNYKINVIVENKIKEFSPEKKKNNKNKIPKKQTIGGG